MPGYECAEKGCVHVDKAEVDRILIIGDLATTDPETGEPLPQLGVILNWLSTHRYTERLRRMKASTSEEEAAVRNELASLRGELKELEHAPRPKTARARIQRTADMEELETDIMALEAKLDRLTAPDPLAEILPSDPEADLVAWWMATDVHRQRALAALLLVPDVLGQVRITPSQGWRDRCRIG